MSAVGSCVLTAEELAVFERDGIVHLGSVLGPVEIDELLVAERRLRVAGSYGASDGLVVMDQVAHVSAAVRRFCCSGAHLDAVEQLLGSAVVLTHNQFVAKLPGRANGESEIPLHQDNGYGALDPPDDVTVWVALTDSTVENGCLVIAPGSHRQGLVEHRVGARNPAFREVSSGEVVPVELAAGEGVVFSGVLMHGSGDNRSDAERIAIFARYCTPEVVMVTEDRRPVLDDGHSWVVRGEAPMTTWRSANEKFTSTIRS